MIGTQLSIYGLGLGTAAAITAPIPPMAAAFGATATAATVGSFINNGISILFCDEKELSFTQATIDIIGLAGGNNISTVGNAISLVVNLDQIYSFF